MRVTHSCHNDDYKQAHTLSLIRFSWEKMRSWEWPGDKANTHIVIITSMQSCKAKWFSVCLLLSMTLCCDYHCTTQTNMPLMFESPFVGKKGSHHNSRTAPPASARDQLPITTSGFPHKPTQSTGDHKQSDSQPVKSQRRRKKKFCPLDVEIGLSRHKMKEEAKNVTVHTRTLNLQAADVSTHCRWYMKWSNLYPNRNEKHSNPRSYSFKCTPNQVTLDNDNSNDYSCYCVCTFLTDIHLKLSKSLLQPSLEIEKTVIAEFTLDSLQPLPTAATTQTPMATPQQSHLVIQFTHSFLHQFQHLPFF